MNANRWISVGALLACWVVPAQAQDAASTLGSLLARADSVVHARFVGATHEGERRAARFTTLATITGRPGTASFTLTEPEGRACGRALAGLIPGAAYVAFLDRPMDGPTRLASSGSRSLPLATPELVRQLRALAAAPRADWTPLLIGALTANDPRVRTDAALDLARRPDLETLAPTLGVHVLDALARGLGDETAPHTALIQATARCRPAGSTAVLVRHFVDASTPWLDRCVLDALARYPGPDVAACLPAHALRGDRTVEIAERLEPLAGAPILAGIAASGLDPAARSRAALALTRHGYRTTDLLRIGVRADDLPRSDPLPRTPTRFRSIDPSLARPGAPR